MSTENTPTPETNHVWYQHQHEGYQTRFDAMITHAEDLEIQRDALKAKLTEAQARAEKANHLADSNRLILKESVIVDQQLTAAQARVEELEKERNRMKEALLAVRRGLCYPDEYVKVATEALYENL